MPALVSFTDFLKSTDEKIITPTTDILNDAVKNNYLLKEMLRGQGDDMVVSAGSRLSDRIMLEDNGSFAFYQPNDVFSPSATNVLTSISIEWRFARSFYTYTDEEIMLNEGDQLVQYKRHKKVLEQAAHTSMFNGMEDALFAYPNANSMESAGQSGKVAYSIAAFIDEIGTDHHWPGFTTIMTVDPATEPRWRNQIATYDPAAPHDEDDGIVAGMDKLWEDVRFESPDTASEYFENDALRRLKILTNTEGRLLYKRSLRILNDRTVSPQDAAYNDPTYSGVPVRKISVLDTALLDQASAASGTPRVWQPGNPRYYFLNCNYIFPIFHRTAYMQTVGPIHGGIGQPFTHVVYKKNAYNLFMRSRQRQGILTPVGFA